MKRLTSITPISTHALREEGDFSAAVTAVRAAHFYPRPPRVGRQTAHTVRHAWSWISTHALREEGDRLQSVVFELYLYFYPRPPRGGRRLCGKTVDSCAKFLPTPSARRATEILSRRCLPKAYFYPRPPRGGRPGHLQKSLLFLVISTHALREEGDPHVLTSTRALRYFYPRPPRGGRPPGFLLFAFDVQFLPTPSARRATPRATGWS